MATLTLRPSAAGDVTTIYDQVPASTFHWDKVDEASPDDATTLVEQSGGGVLKYDLYNLPDHTTETGTINSVKCYIRVNNAIGTSGADLYARIKIKTVSTEYDNGSNLLPSGWTNYSYTWSVNPNTGAAWTWTQIDALQAGVALFTTDFNYVVQCTQVYVEVDYTPVTPPTVTVSAATSVEATTATLNGDVTATGGDNPTVTVYWGTSDGGQVAGNWGNSSAPTSPSQPQGVAAFTKNITGLSGGTLYYFSAKATNSDGTDWPPASLSFTTKGAVMKVNSPRLSSMDRLLPRP